MLKTNSKKAKANIRNYILDNFDPSNYYDDFWGHIEANRKDPTVELDRFSIVAHEIYSAFYAEVIRFDKRYAAGKTTEFALFEYWLGGLPPILDTCYYYNRSAIADLGDILEETETERARFTETDAAKMLTRLIYREITEALSC